MEKKEKPMHPDEWLKDISVEPEIQGFKPEEMISCPKCERKSPPTRLKCFYCGAELPVSLERIEAVKPQPRKLEAWEKGFNIILLPNPTRAEIDETKLAEIARMSLLEKEDLQRLFEADAPLPLVRAESEKEAEIIAKKLSENKLENRILSDEQLKIETPPRRLRGIEFDEDKLVLILFNSDEIEEIRREDLSLIVTGAIFERRIEATERHKKKSAARKVLDTSETSADELLIDVYARGDETGYRIATSGFDFSWALGAAEKGILARENMLKLIEKLRGFSDATKFVNDYLQIRYALGKIWEVEQKRDSRGLQRKAFGRFDLENVTTINNLAQFTKYSRLQWHLL